MPNASPPLSQTSQAQSAAASEVEDQKLALWDQYYKSLSDSYLLPNEYVVRTFLGTYPALSMEKNYEGARVCDISCGDGRNLVLLNKLGMSLHASEISEDICEITRRKLMAHSESIAVDIRPGKNWDLPFPDGFFDYLLSWNALYYMENEQSCISAHVDEFARILRPGGYLVASVPAPGCFSLVGAEPLGGDLIRINNASRWDILNGSIYHLFRTPDDIARAFSSHFHNFCFATLNDDCFGLAMEYYIFTCQRK